MPLPRHLQALLEAGLLRRRQGYRGRFAPSPTGALHRGNLRTALLGWLHARMRGGEWLLRLDDLDTPRNRPGAEASILADLRWLGLDWDGPLLRQSQRRGLYGTVLSALRRQGLLYPCRCSRRLLADISAPHGALTVYPGTCRGRDGGWGPLQGRLPSWRLRLGPKPRVRKVRKPPWRGLGWAHQTACSAGHANRHPPAALCAPCQTGGQRSCGPSTARRPAAGAAGPPQTRRVRQSGGHCESAIQLHSKWRARRRAFRSPGRGWGRAAGSNR